MRSLRTGRTNRPRLPRRPPWQLRPIGLKFGVEWDITNDVKAWCTGEIPNYGTMIKVANETRVSDASSGFWSREYPVGAHEEWRPRLEVLVDGEPTFVYNAAISVAGLPAGLPANLVVDGGFYKSLSIGDEVRITFDEGTSHTIAVSGVLMGEPGVRYVCDINQTRVTDATWQVFVYATEYLVNITSEPGNVFEAPQPSWYRSGMSVPVVRTSGDTIHINEGERLVFDAWYLDGTRMGAEPTTLIVDSPISLVAKYGIEYYLSVASSFGVTSGSGWYKKDTVASFSVDRNAIPASWDPRQFGSEEVVPDVGWISGFHWRSKRGARLDSDAETLRNYCGLAGRMGSSCHLRLGWSCHRRDYWAPIT